MAMNHLSIEERIRIGTQPKNENGCMLFTGRRDSHGYGQVKNHGKAVLVHRWVYERERGPIPAGRLICHTCDIRNCVNPEHLYIGTDADNAADKVARGRTGDRPRGFAHKRPMAKLTEQQVREIKSLLSRGYRQCDIATDYRVSRQIISDIALRKTWFHIP